MPWTYLFLHFLASFIPFVMAGAQCKTEVSIPGMALDGFVFEIISVTAPHQCNVRCEIISNHIINNHIISLPQL